MAELKTDLTMNTSQHDAAIDAAADKVKQYGKAAGDASKNLNDMGGSAKRSTREILNQINQMEGGVRSTSNYRRQLAQMSRDISDLTIAYRSMSKEQKEGAFGQEVQSRISELTAKAAEYKDAIGDAQDAIKNLASDSFKWDAVKQGIELASGALETFVGMNALGEQSTEKLTGAIATMKTISAGAGTVIKTINALQDNSAVIKGVIAIKEKALAAATALSTKNTKLATIAQKAFNAVANANPYVLLATAVVAVTGAIIAFSRAADDSAKAQKKLNDIMKDSIDATDELNSATNTEISNTNEEASKIKILHKVATDNNKSMQERIDAINTLKQICPEYQGNLTKEGELINDNTKALDDYVKGLRSAARAQATFNTAMKLYQEADEIDAQLAQMSPADRNRRKNQKAKEKAMSNRMYADKLVETLGAGKYANQVAGAKTATTPASTGGSPSSVVTKVEFIPDENSITALKAKVSDLKKILEGTDPNSEKYASIKEEFTAANEELTAMEAHIARMNAAPFEPLPTIDSSKLQGKAETDSGGLAGLMPSEENIQALEDFETQYIKTMETVEGYASIASSVGNAFQSLGSAVGGTAGDMISFAGTVAQTVATVLPQIASLITAYQAESLAGGTASAASMPFPANIAAIAAIVAEIIAMFASFPKFATGGIVQGPISGDRVLARLNGNEMVLNGHQQSNLFNLLDKGNSDIGAASNVHFVIRGSDLYGALSNYNKIQNKI